MINYNFMKRATKARKKKPRNKHKHLQLVNRTDSETKSETTVDKYVLDCRQI